MEDIAAAVTLEPNQNGENFTATDNGRILPSRLIRRRRPRRAHEFQPSVAEGGQIESLAAKNLKMDQVQMRGRVFFADGAMGIFRLLCPAGQFAIISVAV